MYKYSDYPTDSSVDPFCLRIPSTLYPASERQRQQRLASYGHDRTSSDKVPLPLDAEAQENFPESCVPRVDDGGVEKSGPACKKC